jgi:hypothetical protein
MNAAEIAVVLGGARREGKQWRARCPLHGGHSLLLRDGAAGRVLATCFGGCDRKDLLAELGRLGLMGAERDRVHSVIISRNARAESQRTAWALALWQAARPALGTLLECYLGSCGLPLAELPPGARSTLRLHPHCRHPSGVYFPAMLALVEHTHHGAVAVHRTFLRDDGSGKANIEPVKASLGPVGGGAVRFGTPRVGEWLAIAEGIETALAVAFSCRMPVWAALSEGGVRNLILPPEATDVVICCDHDANGVGQRAADNAAKRFLSEGRRVRIAFPPAVDSDFADMLAGFA